MTIVTSRREVKPAQARVVEAARRANASAISSPRLARGREEKLVRSRSSTPPGHGQAGFAPEKATPRDSEEHDFFDRAGSPTTSVATRSVSFSYGATPTPSLSTASAASPRASMQARWKHERSQSQYSDLTDITEDHASDITSSSGAAAAFADSSQSFLRHPGLSFDRFRTFESEPPETTSPPYQAAHTIQRVDSWSDRRTLPLAPWPAGKPRGGESTVNRDEDHNYNKRKGVKTPYASQEKKDKVKAVRLSGACMRCVIFRQACEVLIEGQSCKACNVTSRKWHIPCTKLWLRDRFVFLLPDNFFDHLQLRNDEAFPRYKPANRSPSFPLKIAKDYGLELEVRVYAVIDLPLDPGMFRKIVFASDTAKPSDTPTLPLMAEHTSQAVIDVERTIRIHMQYLSTQPAELKLPDIIFPPHTVQSLPHGQNGQAWVKEVFTMVCRFQESVVQGQSQAIGFALKAIYVRFLMGRTFTVPGKDISGMNENLPDVYKLDTEVLDDLENEVYGLCPKYVDRFVKAVLFKSLKTALLPKCFTEVEELFYLMEKDHGKSKLSEWSRDEAFCAIVVVLLLAGHCQIKIAQSMIASFGYNWGNVNDHPDGPDTLQKQATACIYEIEREVIDHLLYLWSYQFGKEKMVGEVRPQDDRVARVAATWKPIGEFQNSKELHGDSIERIHTELDLNRTGPDEFVRDNLTRVLKRLDEVLWRPKERRR